MSKIGAVVGSALWDLTLTAPRLPEAGETVLATAARLTPGGKALNQAVALAPFIRERAGAIGAA
ncbi:MAG: hypothetical protein K1X71_21105 [Pirellulales bacterium]|nr:hypothetical protein [Pirellulales bacterium]